MKRIYGMAILAALFALAAAAQDAVTQKKMAEDLNTEITNMRVKVIGMVGGVMSNVKNAPYRADQITETTQTLGDGTRIHNEHQVTLYRDSQGRVRREMPEEISIMDPNSGVSYILNTKNMTARKMQVSVSVNSGNSDAGVFAFRTLTLTGPSAIEEASLNSPAPTSIEGSCRDLSIMIRPFHSGRVRLMTLVVTPPRTCPRLRWPRRPEAREPRRRSGHGGHCRRTLPP